MEAWRAYYERERVEDVFKVVKKNVGGNRFRPAKNESTEGKIFVMFLASAVGMMFRQRVNQASQKEYSYLTILIINYWPSLIRLNRRYLETMLIIQKLQVFRKSF